MCDGESGLARGLIIEVPKRGGLVSWVWWLSWPGWGILLGPNPSPKPTNKSKGRMKRFSKTNCM